MLRKNLPNYLTYFRIAVIPMLVVAFYVRGEAGYILSGALFILASITDWLDGYVARKWNAQSNVGRFLDPIADKVLVCTTLMLLVGEHRGVYVNGEAVRLAAMENGQALMIPAIAIVCREILVSGLREFLAEIRISVPVSRLAKWKTGVQMTAISLLLIATAGPWWLFCGYLGNALLCIAAALTLVTGYAYVKTGWTHLNKPE